MAWIERPQFIAHLDRARPLFSFLLLIIGLILAQPALASDLIVSRTVLDDPTGALTIADVAGRVTDPAGSALFVTNAKTVHWLCLRVRAPEDGSPVVLFIRPNFLNGISLYEAGSGSPLTWETHVAGNRTANGLRERTLGFVVNVPAPEATYYLRLQTSSPSPFRVEALEPAEAEQMDHRRDLLVMFFLTAMLCLLFWALFSYSLDRQPEVGLFAIYLAVYILFGIVANGYLAPFSPARYPQMANWVATVLYLAVNFTVLLFCREMFKLYEPHPLLMRGLNLLLWAFPVLLAAILLGYIAFAIDCNAALIQITWLYFAVIAFTFREEEFPHPRIVQAFFVAVCLSNAAFWMANRSGGIASAIDLNAMQLMIVNGLVVGGLFAGILKAREYHSQQRAQRSFLDLLQVQKRFYIEKELKKQAEAQALTDFLTGVYNRRHFVASAECELSRAFRFQRPLSLLMIDIDHFKAINDTWGHGFGDIVLQEISHLIRDALRNMDIFGRTGGEEFAAVLVETEGDGALRVAQRLCAIVADAVLVPPGAERIQVTVSIGLSQLKGRSISFDNLLNEADQAMYAAKEAGRNGFSVYEPLSA